MPRKRRAFIDRSKAHTFQVVYKPLKNAAGEHQLVPVDPSAPDDPTSTSPLQPFQTDYSRDQFELGEFGFPDDGYDYSKHFLSIGGGGGVFMDAATGLPNPEAVSSFAAATAAKEKENESFMLKEQVQPEQEQQLPEKSWLDPRDEQLKQEAIQQIRRDRKKDPDLDAIFAALDSDGELESNTDTDADAVTESAYESGFDDSALLDDNFVQLADVWDEQDESSNLDLGEPQRPQRILDEQFELLMQQYAADDSDDFEDDFADDEHDIDEQDEDDLDASAQITQDDLTALLDGEGLLDGFSSLHIEEQVDDDDHLQLPLDDALADRAAEVERFTNAEFEQGMDKLLDSYTRISASEALEAIDGIDVALAAIARNEEQEKELLRVKEELGIESDGHDSELDSKFEDDYRKDEQWDCETILSTYSNLENHPSVIDAPANLKRRPSKQQPIIRLDPRTQAPEGYGVGAEGRSDAVTADYGTRREPVATSRKGETKEEKRLRKAAVKEAARERRALKSEMRKAFGQENVKQSKHAASLGTSKVAVQF